MTVLDIMDAHTARQQGIEAGLIARIEAIWNAQTTYHKSDRDAFVARVLPLVRAGQLTMAQLTAAYIAEVMTEVTGARVRPAVIPGAVATQMRGVDPTEVYGRPFVPVWESLARGDVLEQAVAIGADRLVRLVSDDFSNARRQATLRSVQADDRITGFRRVIHPELATKSGTCGLCIAASTQVYATDQLMPIHTHCGCQPMPIVSGRGGTIDPGRDINGEDIDTLYRNIGATRAKDLASARYVVNEHGELGPVLTRADLRFTGPDDI